MSSAHPLETSGELTDRSGQLPSLYLAADTHTRTEYIPHKCLCIWLNVGVCVCAIKFACARCYLVQSVSLLDQFTKQNHQDVWFRGRHGPGRWSYTHTHTHTHIYCDTGVLAQHKNKHSLVLDKSTFSAILTVFQNSFFTTPPISSNH